MSGENSVKPLAYLTLDFYTEFPIIQSCLSKSVNCLIIDYSTSTILALIKLADLDNV